MTYLQTLERTDRSTSLNWLGDGGAERAPVVERANAKELNEGVDFLHIVLPMERLVSAQVLTTRAFHSHGSTSETPPEL